MVKNKFLIYIIKLITIIAVVGCSSKAESDFNKVIEVMGDKFENGYAQTGGAKGSSWFTFDGDNLSVEYTAQANVTPEQILTNSGNIYRETETYSLRDFKLEGRVEDDGNLRKLISGKWDGNKFFYITFYKINKGESLDEYGFGEKFMGKFAEKDSWQMTLGVNWGSDDVYAMWTGLLNSKQESKLLPILELNDQDSDDKLAIDEALGSYNYKIYNNNKKALKVINYRLYNTIKYRVSRRNTQIKSFFDDEYDWKEYSSMYKYNRDIEIKIGSQIKRGPYMLNSNANDCKNCDPHYIDDLIKSENPKFSFLIDGVDHNLNEFYVKFNDFLQADWKSKDDKFKKAILRCVTWKGLDRRYSLCENNDWSDGSNDEDYNDGSFDDIYIMFPASKKNKLNDLPDNVVLVIDNKYDCSGCRESNYFAFVINKNTDIKKATLFDTPYSRVQPRLKDMPAYGDNKESKYVGSLLRKFLDTEIDEIKYDKININDISDNIIPAIYFNSNSDDTRYWNDDYIINPGNKLLKPLKLE